MPDGTAGMLIVITVTPKETGRLVQMLAMSTGTIYLRNYLTSTDKWSSWIKV